MERAARTSRQLAQRHRNARRRGDDVRHTLAEVSHGILRMIVAAAEGHYNGVDAPPPVFLVQNLVAKSGANMHKRRVYDVLHFWEAIGLVRRAQGKGAYVWHGETGYKAFRHRLALQDPETSTCRGFVNSEVSWKGWSHAQRLATAIFYLFEHHPQWKGGERWNRDDFWRVAQDAAAATDMPNVERRYYDVLNVFMSLSIVTSHIVATKHKCRMSWTPDALSCLPPSEFEVSAVSVLCQDERVRIAAAAETMTALPKRMRKTKKPPPGPPISSGPPPSSSMSLPSPPPAMPMRPLRKRAPPRINRDADWEKGRKKLGTSLTTAFVDEDITALPPPPPLTTAFDAADADSLLSTSSSSSSLLSSVESPDHFACDLNAWNEFSAWAGSEGALIPLFPYWGDLMTSK